MLRIRVTNFLRASCLGSALVLGACADHEQHDSAQLMDRSDRSDLGQIEEGSTDVDNPGAAPQQPSQAMDHAPTGKYQWNGNPERLSVGRNGSDDAVRQPRIVPNGLAKATPQTPPDARIVIVQKGDTLHSLAGRHNVTVASLNQANRLSGAPLQIGQRLVLPPVAR